VINFQQHLPDYKHVSFVRQARRKRAKLYLRLIKLHTIPANMKA